MTQISYIDTHPETRPFWDAAAEGRFVVPTCGDCGRSHWHPRPFCPFCSSSAIELRSSEGHGTLYSFSVVRAAASPYVVAYVTLDEGPTMLTNIVDGDPDGLAIGDRVQVVFKPLANGLSAPMFTPAPEPRP